MLESAVADGLIARNPADGAKRPRVDDEPVVPFTDDEIDALRAATPGWFDVALTLGLGAGLRQREASGLTVDRVDFLRRTLTVDRQLVTAGAGRPTFGPLKTKRSYRKVPLADSVIESLARHVEVHGAGRDGLLLHCADGRPVQPQYFGQVWRKLRERAGLPDGEVPRHPPHVRLGAALRRRVGGGGSRLPRAQSGGAVEHLRPPDAGRPRPGALRGRGGVPASRRHDRVASASVGASDNAVTCGYAPQAQGRRLIPLMKKLCR